MAYQWQRTLLVINPASQSGAADAVGSRAEELLRAAVPQLDVVRTRSTEHAINIGAGATDYNTVIVLGGDGVLHQVAQGLMTIPADRRPVLGVIPMGSGNDYARTVAIPAGVEAAVAALLAAQPAAMDVVQVNDQYVLETVSFGLDAAIAIGTFERRKRTGETGLKLYAMTALDEVTHRLYDYHYHVTLDGDRQLDGTMKLFAVQNGKFYGGGFNITPMADATDGMLDLCIAEGGISIPTTLFTVLLAMKGKHTGSKYVSFHRASSLTISFDDAGVGMPKCQMDGEAYDAPSYTISVLPAAIRVLHG